MMSIKHGISVADTEEHISRGPGAARIGPDDPVVSTAVTSSFSWHKIATKTPQFQQLYWLEQRISGTFLALPKQSIWRSPLKLRFFFEVN
jgi:hypothetical protein